MIFITNSYLLNIQQKLKVDEDLQLPFPQERVSM
jgi:hypothetical protein